MDQKRHKNNADKTNQNKIINTRTFSLQDWNSCPAVWNHGRLYCSCQLGWHQISGCCSCNLGNEWCLFNTFNFKAMCMCFDFWNDVFDRVIWKKEHWQQLHLVEQQTDLQSKTDCLRPSKLKKCKTDKAHNQIAIRLWIHQHHSTR